MLPAYAGMILTDFDIESFIISAPRVCGDDPPGRKSWQLLSKCSPRMRG